MKKLIAFILLLAILLPSINVDAATKVADPTVSISYNTKKGSWYITVKASSKSNTIYCRDNATGCGKFKKIKNNSKIKCDYGDSFSIKAKAGKKYSSTKTYRVYDLMKKQTDKDAKKLAKEIIGNSTTDFDKFFKISKYCVDNWSYGRAKTATDPTSSYTYMHIIYDKEGVCADLAYGYQKLLNAVGVKAQYITDDTCGKYGYEYRPMHAWTHVQIDGQWQLIDISAAVCTDLSNLQADIYGMYSDVAETNTLGLDNGRLWVSTEVGLIPISNYMNRVPEDNLVYSENEITYTYSDYPTASAKLVYDESIGYWHLWMTIDGETTMY